MGGLFRCGLAGKVRYVVSWSGAALRGEAWQAWLVQDCYGASGRVKVRYGGAGKARYGTAR